MRNLVFIGVGMDPASITQALDACLVEADGFTPEQWQALDDPFPQWDDAQPVLETV